PQLALTDLAEALVAIGDRDSARPLRQFLLTYRSDPLFLDDPATLDVCAEGLLKLGGAEGRRTVVFVAEDKRTIAPVAEYARRLLSGQAPQRASSSKAKKAVR